MSRLLYFFLIFYYHSFISRATALIGETVRQAEENEFPFVVSLSYKSTSKYAKTEEKSHECSGSLITTMHVLTAAHCIDQWHDYSDIIVKVGSIDWLKARTYEVRSWISFMKWAKPADHINPHAYYDVAIVILRSNVNSSIRLPIITGKTEAELYNKKVRTAGWNVAENAVNPRFMKTAKLIVLEPEQCSFDEIHFPSRIDELMRKLYICSKAEPVVNLTYGDSGGPVLFDQQEIIAINSYVWPNKIVKKLKYQNMHQTISSCKKFIASVTNGKAKFGKGRPIDRQ